MLSRRVGWHIKVPPAARHNSQFLVARGIMSLFVALFLSTAMLRMEGLMRCLKGYTYNRRDMDGYSAGYFVALLRNGLWDTRQRRNGRSVLLFYPDIAASRWKPAIPDIRTVESTKRFASSAPSMDSPKNPVCDQPLALPPALMRIIIVMLHYVGYNRSCWRPKIIAF